jgi:hypothetical protein
MQSRTANSAPSLFSCCFTFSKVGITPLQKKKKDIWMQDSIDK